MKEFNPYILLVMRWLQDNNSVRQEELQENKFKSLFAANGIEDEKHFTYKAAYSAHHGSKATTLRAARVWSHKANNALNSYFELINEDRNLYEKRARRLNILNY